MKQRYTLVLCSLFLFGLFIMFPDNAMTNGMEDEVKQTIKAFYESTFNPVVPHDNQDVLIADHLVSAIQTRNQSILDNINAFDEKDDTYVTECIVNYYDGQIANDSASFYFEGIIKCHFSGKEGESLTADDYYIELKKEDNHWKVIKVYSTCPWDSLFAFPNSNGVNFSFTDTSVSFLEKDRVRLASTKDIGEIEELQFFSEDQLQHEKEKREREIQFWKDVESQTLENNAEQELATSAVEMLSGRFHDHGYNRSAVVQYLYTWAYGYNDEQYPRPPKAKYDCANFASQAMTAGGILADGTGDYQWGFNSPNPNAQNLRNPRYAWFSASGLHDYCSKNNGGPNSYGLSGSRYWLDIKDQYYHQDMKQGDLVFLCDGGVPYHTMIVHSTGSNAGNIGISAHTTARRNYPLKKLGLGISSTRQWLGLKIRGNYGY